MPPRSRLLALRVVSPLSAALVATGCLVLFHRVGVQSVERSADSVDVRTPVKAHLLDGSTVLYREGAAIVRDTVRGAGWRYGLTLRDSGAVEALALDSVVGMETFRTETDAASSIIVSTLGTAGAVSAVAGVVVLISCINDPKCFGSCPTFYSDSAGTYVLEAEGFSYSVAPIFESRDVDRLRLRVGADGIVRLEVRNEALETHYINHLALLEVQHAPDELALSDAGNRPLVVRDLAAPARARDRAGRDLRATLLQADGVVFRTADRTLAAASREDLTDTLELAVPAPPGVDSVALVLRLRNSLLNTVLFYDVMLGDPGPRALDWMGEDLERVGPALELGSWFAQRMGMRVLVRGDGGWREVGRVRDTGPVAWKDVAVVVPVAERDSVRLKLAFPADNWRIDRVAVARGVGRPAAIEHAITAVLDARDAPDSAARANVAAPDRRYLELGTAQRFTAAFRTEARPPAAARTFLLVSQGYYTEWVRRAWLRAPRTDGPFVPSDSALYEAMARWRTSQDTLEARFMATRVPVR